MSTEDNKALVRRFYDEVYKSISFASQMASSLNVGPNVIGWACCNNSALS